MVSPALPRSLRIAFTSALVALLVGACANGAKVQDSGNGGGTTSTGGGHTEVCRLHSCDSDAECGACTEGNQTCLLSEHRCVACDPMAGNCPQGEFCSEFGACVPEGQTCITNDNGVPTITCTTSEDCLACDSLHHVCDTESSRCVTCTDADVSACGGPSACNSNRCAECSPTVACPDDKLCTAGGRCAETRGSTGVGGGTGGGGGSTGVTSTGVGGGTGGGTTGPCHEVCEVGDTMATTCDPCVAKLCAADAFCCKTEWDAQCVSEVPQYCGDTCPVTTGTGSSTGTGGSTCAHDVCMAGAALNALCTPCATSVCTEDPYCCAVKWDASCVDEVTMYCPPGC